MAGSLVLGRGFVLCSPLLRCITALSDQSLLPFTKKTLVVIVNWGVMYEKVYVLQISSKSRSIFIGKHRFKEQWGDTYGKD